MTTKTRIEYPKLECAEDQIYQYNFKKIFELFVLNEYLLIGHSGTAFVVQYLKILPADTDKRKQENALIQEQASSFSLIFHIKKCVIV